LSDSSQAESEAEVLQYLPNHKYIARYDYRIELLPSIGFYVEVLMYKQYSDD